MKYIVNSLSKQRPVTSKVHREDKIQNTPLQDFLEMKKAICLSQKQNDLKERRKLGNFVKL